MKQGISVMICTHNGSKRIKKTLECLLAQKVNPSIPWEVVLVDNASTDGTVEIAQSTWTSDVPLRIIKEPALGVGNARARGMNTSQFSYIGFVDDDNCVAENWVETAFTKMEANPDAGAIGGPSEAVFEIPEPEWFSRYEKNYAVGQQYDQPGKIVSKNGLLWGAGMVIRKEAWDMLYDKGFVPILQSRKGRQLLSGEETEILLLFKLMGLSLYYFPELKIRHMMPSHRLTWQYCLRLRKGLGASSPYLGIYRSVLTAIGQDKAIHPIRWISALIKSLGKVLRDPLALLAGIFNIKQGNFRIAMAYFYLGRFFQILKIGIKGEKLQITLYNRYVELKNIWKEA
jgi:glycosyltransferase involved in cell wall biosynthesis